MINHLHEILRILTWATIENLIFPSSPSPTSKLKASLCLFFFKALSLHTSKKKAGSLYIERILKASKNSKNYYLVSLWPIWFSNIQNSFLFHKSSNFQMLFSLHSNILSWYLSQIIQFSFSWYWNVGFKSCSFSFFQSSNLLLFLQKFILSLILSWEFSSCWYLSNFLDFQR